MPKPKSTKKPEGPKWEKASLPQKSVAASTPAKKETFMSRSNAHILGTDIEWIDKTPPRKKGLLERMFTK